MKKFLWLLSLFLGVMLCFAWSSFAEIELPSIFGRNMVLQRDMEILVWGWADPGEAVIISIADQLQKTKADLNGKCLNL